MRLVLDTEVDPDYRYLAPQIERLLPESQYQLYHDDPIETVPDGVDGVVISGSTASVYDPDHREWVASQSRLVADCLKRSIPLLGICFGHQLINHALGGTVERDRRRATFVEMEVLAETDRLLGGIPPIVPVLHGDLVVTTGDPLEPIARTDYDEHFCTRHPEAPVWTVQFHPEFTERVADRPADWDSGDWTFADSRATLVLERFGSVCGKLTHG